ncbi:MAG: N-6 DNA methylase [Candidatus Heimdallarchaeota archaeon]|nr:N-6 DNA methylase [Candidatus Heimdallarchaeota archaeon]
MRSITIQMAKLDLEAKKKKEFFKQLKNYAEIVFNALPKAFSSVKKSLITQRFFQLLFFLEYLCELELVISKNNNQPLSGEELFNLINSQEIFLNNCKKIIVHLSSNRSETLSLNDQIQLKLPYFHFDLFPDIQKWDFALAINRNDWEKLTLFLNSYSWVLPENYSENAQTKIQLKTKMNIPPKIIGELFEKGLMEFDKESVRKEGEKQKKDKWQISKRRSKGLFFTPEEVTDYICRKTIHPFLLEKNYRENETLESIFPSLSEPVLRELLNSIQNITVLDPACGSGDFVIKAAEILYNLQTKILQQLQLPINEFMIRREIIKKNLFAVDILDEAIQITKLRLWLWLLSVYTQDQKKHMDYCLLPDLDFHFKCGNTLIGLVNELLSIETSFEFRTNDLLPLIKQLLKALENRERNLTSPEKRTVTILTKIVTQKEKKNLRNKLNSLYLYLSKVYEMEKYNHTIQKMMKKLLIAIQLNFSEALNKNYLQELWDKSRKLTSSNFSLANLVTLKPFHWHLHFQEILDKDGFDIIIGNPPYLENKKIKDKLSKEIYRQTYESAYKLYDLSVVFIERAYQLLREKGHFAYIITNKFISTDYGEKIRELILTQTKIQEIIDVSYLPVFKEAATYPIIIVFQKSPKNARRNLENIFRISDELTKLNELSSEAFNYTRVKQSDFYSLPKHLFVLKKSLWLVKYIDQQPAVKRLGDLGNFSYRILGFTNWPKIVSNVRKEKASSRDLAFIGTTNVKRFYIRLNKPLRLAKRTFKKNYLPYEENFRDQWKIFEIPKLLVKEVAKNLTVAFDLGNFANVTGIYMFIPKNEEYNKLLLAILNSKLMDHYFKTLFSGTHMAGRYLRFNGSYLKELPIIIPDKMAHQKTIVQLVNILLFLYQYNYQDQRNAFGSESSTSQQISFFEKLLDHLIVAIYCKPDQEEKIFSLVTNQIKNISYDHWMELYLRVEQGEKGTEELSNEKIKKSLEKSNCQKIQEMVNQLKTLEIVQKEINFEEIKDYIDLK